MAKQTTTVNLVIESSDLIDIVEGWATQTGFSVYSKSREKIIYMRKIRLNLAWLSVETNGKDARLEAWLSPNGVGPDFKGNLWKGRKVPVLKGYLFGPVAIYRRQLDELLRDLGSKAERTTEEGTTSWYQSPSQPVLKKSTFVTGMVILGSLSLASGLLGIYNARSDLMRSLMPNFAENFYIDSTFDALFGVLVLVSSWILSRGKALGVWLYGGAILLDITFDLVIGHPVNYFVIGFSLLFMWYMTKLKSQWKLT